ncbi:type II secretion system protein GspE [Tepidimonas fonticaldi]|uniref:Type II secretion system protein E n=1 Tax=Tepidimonas fonticaldi TaxID=1101373 RepID=A0A1A6DZ28_9BURK|nr:type II secretion system ATPase GspE [Tepidimonas fonticaldi]OBS31931.1 type II secretion system protein GspE [Tepidimonas fonticaldi]
MGSGPSAVAAARPPLGHILVERGKLQARDLERALAAQRETPGYLIGQVLVRLGLVTDVDVLDALSEQLHIPSIALDQFPPFPPEVPGLLPEFQRSQLIYPLALEGQVLTVALANPQDGFVVKALQLATGLQIEPRIALEADIEKALQGLGTVDDGEQTQGQGDDADASEFVEHLKDLASEAPVIRKVNQIVGRVVDMRASDIHLEPFEDGLHVRYRVDGVIATHEVLPSALAAAVTSRVKLMAHLDIAERRLPQDGRIRSRVKGRDLDLRVSTAPTVHGESVVMRVLDRSSVRFELDQMGFAPDTLAHFRALVERPHGILLVTGPTGSGKTTTLYAALAKIDADAHKIITVEDPVEYQLPGINQIQVHSAIGLTFARTLRAILRQDPDIIMIGEMRDAETAQIAVQSALTGHLVLSTLHTNTAAGAVIRLQDMGIERYLITSSVIGVLSQRLVRRLCPACKAPQTPTPRALQDTGLDRFLAAGQPIYRPVGCDQCRGTGYLGRTGVHELLMLDDALRRSILDGADAARLHAQAVQAGMLTLRDDGLRKVASGETSLDEVLRVTEDQSDA